MKIYTSYFYMVRFFTPNMLPISTAKWDPKWFHNFQGQKHCFIDRRGVLNGVRADAMAPDASCDKLCRGPETCNYINPKQCDFLRMYRKQLDKIDFEKFIKNMAYLRANFTKLGRFKNAGEFIPVFLVHEAPTNPCSERVVIQQWFSDNGVKVTEWGGCKN